MASEKLYRNTPNCYAGYAFLLSHALFTRFATTIFRFKKMQFIAYMGAYKQNSFYLRQGVMKEAKASFQENIISCLNIHTLLFIKLIPLFDVPKL